MFFPLRVKDVERDPFDPAARIDREIGDRNRRLAAGSCLVSDLESVTSALVVASGRGKHLRILSAATTCHRLPDCTARTLQEMVDDDQPPTLADLRTLQADIAMIQAAAIEELKCSAGKYIDRLLFAAVTQPDELFENENLHGRTSIEVSDPHLLAEQTGLTIVSNFANQDMLAGGSGRNLDALPAWLLFGDRSCRTASVNRILFCIGKTARALFLPASDGIDSELPRVQLALAPGLNRFDGLESVFGPFQCGRNDRELSRLNLEGSVSASTKAAELLRLLKRNAISEADYVRSSVVGIVGEITERIRQVLPDATQVDEIIVDTTSELNGTFANQFRRNWRGVNFFDGFGWENRDYHLPPILAATLGILSIDQLPANIPWITGARCQKLLGNLTPGSPAKWRQLLRDMADFQPPVMRLRDAV